MYDVILKISIHVSGSFRSFRRETSTIQRSISTIFTTYKSPQNLSKQSCQSKGTFQPGRPIIRPIINYLRLASTSAIPLIIRPAGSINHARETLNRS